MNLAYLAVEQAATLILITADPVWPRISQLGMTTSLDYPDMEERAAQISEFCSRYGGRFLIEWDGRDCERAAMLMRGFSERQIENVLSTLLIEKQGLHRADLGSLTGQKRRVYAARQPFRSQSAKIPGCIGPWKPQTLAG